MDKLIYDAQSLLTSIKMGANIDKNKHLLESIQQIESKQVGSSFYIDPNMNYDGSQVSELQRKQSRLRKNLESAVNDVKDHVDNYKATALAYALKNYTAFTSQLENAKKNQKELDNVTATFGEFSLRKTEIKRNKKVERYKTSEELTEERNERLAMLNEMHASGKIDDETLKTAVVSLRRVYQREIETAVAHEVEENSKKISKKEKISSLMSNRFKVLASKLSRVFKLNTKQAEVKEAENFEKFIINQNAMQALGKVFDITASTENLAKEGVQQELCNLANTSQEIRSTTKEDVVVDVKLACKIMKVDVENIQNTELRNLKINRALNFGGLMVPDSTGRYIPNKNIKAQKEAYIEYMHNHNEIVYDASSGVPVEKFKDENVAREYAETLKKFDKNIERMKELSKQYDKYTEVLNGKFDAMGLEA